MHAGLLSSRLTLEAPARVADGAGGAVITWIVEDAVWAHVEPRTGRERPNGDGTSALVSHRVTIRHRDGVTPEMRFLWGARVLAIKAVLDDGRGRWMTCLCEAEQAA